MRLIDADAFENYVLDEWKNNEISNGDWMTFREWLRDQETVVEFDGAVTKVIVRGVEYVPGIRCKDCKKRYECFIGLFCGRDGEKEFFCSCAERKEE